MFSCEAALLSSTLMLRAQSILNVLEIQIFHQRTPKQQAVGLFYVLGAKKCILHPLNPLVMMLLDQGDRNILTFPPTQAIIASNLLLFGASVPILVQSLTSPM
jgi:hypothetical protein